MLRVVYLKRKSPQGDLKQERCCNVVTSKYYLAKCNAMLQCSSNVQLLLRRCCNVAKLLSEVSLRESGVEGGRELMRSIHKLRIWISGDI